MIKRPPIVKIALIQAVIVIIIVLLITIWNKNTALNIFYGAMIFLIPNFYFSWQTFRFIGAGKSRQIARSIYKGQAGKFFLTVSMFAVLFKLIKPEESWIVFVSYAVNNIMHLLITLIIVKRSKSILN